MKNIKIILSALIISLFSSCQDAIDIIQPGELSPENVFTSVADLQKGLVGVYGQMSLIGEISFNSIFTDEVCIGYANGGQGINDGTYGFVLNTNSGDATSIWGGNYSLINSANRVIAGGEKLLVGLDPKNTDDQKTINDINKVLAEAKAMRAFGHFRLLSYFSTDLTSNSALGVILMDHVPTLTEHLPRSTNGQVFDFINKDLDFAENILTFGADNKKISVDFVNALRARMAVYRGDYVTAEKYAQPLIDGYPLTDFKSYSNIWDDVDKTDSDGNPVPTEVIFRIDHIKGDAEIGGIWASVNATVKGSPFFAMSTDLFQLMDNSGDVRRSVFVAGDSNTDFVNFHGRIAISKYKGTTLKITKEDGTPGTDVLSLLNDEKVFRSSEMYFILAECKAAAGDMAGVASTLQSVIDARFFSDKPEIAVPANAKAAWAEILKQRRIELCYEGHRYLDLKRLGVKAGVDIQRNPNDCAVNGACFLSSSDYRFTLPIPNAEKAANPAVKDQQNPGYIK